MPLPPSKRKKKRSRLGPAAISLTSLMDIFTIILLFMLKSYSAEGDILATKSEKLQLPVSTSKQSPKMTLIVQISTDDIIVDGKKVADIGDVIDSEELLIKSLADALSENMKKTEFIARKNPDFKFSGEALIQGDKGIPFLVLEKVMFTCGNAGYGNISLAVMSRE